MSATLHSLILALSVQFQVSPYMVAAVIETESKWDPASVGDLGERGLLQLRPEYFLLPGESVEVLHKPEENLKRGIKYLAKMQARCVHKEAMQFVVCFNAGPTGARAIQDPASFPYYLKFKENYERLKAENIFQNQTPPN